MIILGKFLANKNKYAFTLAEVLIAIVIIGIVTIMTIPQMIANYQKRQTEAKLKKIYGTFIEANNKAISDYGPIGTWKFSSAQDFINKYMKPYYKISLMCKPYPATQCKMKYKMSNGNMVNYTTQPKFVLADGTVVAVHSYAVVDTCPNKGFTCGGTYVFIDINGDRGPNEAGKDVFQFTYYVYQNKFYIDNLAKQVLGNTI